MFGAVLGSFICHGCYFLFSGPDFCLGLFRFWFGFFVVWFDFGGC